MTARIERRATLRDGEEPAVETFLALVRAYECVAAEAAKFFQPFGITMQQFNVLRVLYVRPKQDGLRCSDIAGRLINREPDMTRLLDRLERAGLIGRHRCTTDRRVVWIELTDKGVDLVEEIHAPLLAFHQERFAHLSTEEQASLRDLLSKVRQGPCSESVEAPCAGLDDSED
jgi:DNA-binding MarR family transcriptional regulator